MESVCVGHEIRDRTNADVAYFNLLDNFNFGLTLSASYLLSFVVILSFSLLINEFICRIRLKRRKKAVRVLKRIVTDLNNFGVKRCSAIGIFVLFVHQFLWITKLLVLNNIKTNKVVSLKFKL